MKKTIKFCIKYTDNYVKNNYVQKYVEISRK